MPDLPILIAFLGAVIAIQLSPGPDMMMVIARGIGQGRKIALTCVAGISAASLVQIPALALSVASIFETSELAYTLLKNAGAAYLVYLGIRFLTSTSKRQHAATNPVGSARSAFFQGFWGNLANPKSLEIAIDRVFDAKYALSNRESLPADPSPASRGGWAF